MYLDILWNMRMGRKRREYVSVISPTSPIPNLQLRNRTAYFLYDADAFVPERHPGWDVVSV